MKVKIKLSGNEMKAVLFILRLADQYGERQHLTGMAAMDSIEKLFMRLVVRMKNFKQGGNTLTLSLQEAWALTYQLHHISNRLEVYEYNTYLRISSEISRVAQTETWGETSEQTDCEMGNADILERGWF